MTATDIPVLFMRLEGPLQAWGLRSRFRIRETASEPTRSGIIGLIACCMGRRRDEPLGELANVKVAVRVDRAGVLWRDYHTVGAKGGVMSAKGGKPKITASTGEPETFLTDRFYLCDASFLVALTGPDGLLDRVEHALRHPVWPPFLGRKSCPPSVPIFAERARHATLRDALAARPWRRRLKDADRAPAELSCLVACSPADPGATLRYDCPVSFAEPRPMSFRHVREVAVRPPVGEPTQARYKPPAPVRMNYRSTAWKQRRLKRGARDGFLCVFCKSPSYITHHITYERATYEDVERDLRSVCRLCHDAITMIEAERDMGRDRIDPLSEEYRGLIMEKRKQIEAERRTGRARKRR